MIVISKVDWEHITHQWRCSVGIRRKRLDEIRKPNTFVRTVASESLKYLLLHPVVLRREIVFLGSK